MRMSIWDEDDHGWLSSPACGLSGGLLLSWDINVIEYQSHMCHNNWIRFTGKISLTGEVFCLFNVYASANLIDKKRLWELMAHEYWLIASTPVMFVGDFNSVRHEIERANCRYALYESQNFNEFIEQQGLEEIDTGNAIFTWFGPKGKKRKVDRALINHLWLDRGHWFAKVLMRKNSDHKPLIIKAALHQGGLFLSNGLIGRQRILS